MKHAGQSREQKRIVPVIFTSRSNLHLPDTIRRPRGGVEGCLKSMCEQTVNRRFCRFLSSIYMGSTTSSLDFLGVLWYHMEVKLGCYATASHGFDSVFCALRAGKPKGCYGVAARRFFLLQRRKTERILSVLPHMRLAVFGRESLSVRSRLPLRDALRVCPTAEVADAGGRAGEKRSGTTASRYVDGSIMPALADGFSRTAG